MVFVMPEMRAEFHLYTCPPCANITHGCLGKKQHIKQEQFGDLKSM